MRIFRFLAIATLIVALPFSADADIFLKKGSNSGSSSQSKSIFLNNNNNAGKRQVPNYPIISDKAGKNSRNNQPISFGSEGARLQAQKLRENRARQYRRNRAESINIMTLAEDYARRTGKQSMDQLLDRSAYNAANQAVDQAVSAAKQQTTAATQQQSQQNNPYMQNIQNIEKQATAQAQAEADRLQQEADEANPGNNNLYDRNNRRLQNNNNRGGGIMLTP